MWACDSLHKCLFKGSVEDHQDYLKSVVQLTASQNTRVQRGECRVSYNQVVMEAYTRAYNDSGHMIQAFGVVNANGQVLWQTNNWDLTKDVKGLVSAVTQKAASVIQNQVKYSTLRSNPDSLVARSAAGNGTLVLVRIEGDKWVVAWANASATPDGIYVDVDRSAKFLKGKIRV